MNESNYDLGGQWSLADAKGDHACRVTLPGDCITALHAAGIIPDPYWGRNEYDCRWVSDHDWVMTRDFTVDRTDLVLVLSMLDTLAQVRVNGQLVLSTDNMFRCYRVDLSDVLQLGQNRIEIAFPNLVAEAARRQAAQRYFVPFSANNTPIHNGNMMRKPSCDFGWDWNIALAPFGVYGDLHLELIKPVRIDAIVIEQNFGPDGVDVRFKAKVNSKLSGRTPFSFIFNGEKQQGQFDVIVGQNELVLDFHVANPDLWWPAGQGQQPLYELQARVGPTGEAHFTTRRIGLRQMELITTKDAAGLGFKFAVNGRDVFAKGANWIPADALAGQITVEKTRDLLQSAVDANMNMIRVWGGGRYEPTWFYDLCDELGLMVWQDFMFSCHIYPADEAFLADVAIEATEQALRLHHHACLAVWCGDNELIGALTWFPETRANRDQYLVGYDRLNRTIETALKAAVPGAVWWPSSPSPGPMDFGDAWHDDSKGDMHFWSVWHEGRDFDHYRDVAPRFCSEFGFQSYPSMDVIRRFADPKDFNIAAPVLESHQKNAGGNARIAETMFRYFRWPQKFEDFVYLSQVQQGLAIKTAVTHWRSLKPHCMGTLIWQLNDTWPVCSWASLDHGGGWKLMHHMARDFFAPVFVTAVPVADGFELRGVNDLAGAVKISVTALAVTMAGVTRELGKGSGVVGGSAAVLLTVPRDAVGPDEMLAFTYEGNDGTRSGDVYAPKPYKSYDLAPSGLTHTATPDGALWTLTISATALAHYVSVESDQPGRFSDNAFHLFPGHPATITFTAQDPKATPAFTLRDLYSATTA